jgi:signal transduction histidine kinase
MAAPMLARLRRRFILAIMGLVGLVLLVVLAASVVSNYQATSSSIEAALDRAVSRGPDAGQRPWVGGQGSNPAPGLFPEILGRPQDGATSGPPHDEHFIPVYVVALNISDLTVLGDNSAFVTIDSSLVREAISAVASKLPQQGLAQGESLTGLLLDPRLFYRVEFSGGKTMALALADASELLGDTLFQIGISALIWLGAMVALFLISLLLSRIMTRPIAEAWERQRRFVADASHELKTPLTVILANNSLLATHPDRTIGEQAQWIASTQAEAQRMDSLVRDLLLLAQADEKEQPQKAQLNALPTVDLSALLGRGLLQFEAVFFERGIELTANITQNVIVRGDAEQLERLIQVLLDNASKYAKPPAVSAFASKGAFVRVNLRSGTGSGTGNSSGNGACALLEITNSGEPIAPDALPHLFERFFRADAAHDDTEGSGLGLSLAQAIVAAHHGSITVSSTPATGTTFTVTLH